MKTPNEPGVDFLSGSGSWSFLSPAGVPAKASREEASTRAVAQRIVVANFTRLLLVPCVARFSSGAMHPRSLPRSHPPRGRPFQSFSDAFRYVPAPSRMQFAKPVPVAEQGTLEYRSRWPAYSNAATVRPPGRPETPWALRQLQAAPHSPAERRRRRPKRRSWLPPPRNSSSTCSRAACSARRNSGSPESRKISATVRPSRNMMRSSRSSKSQFNRCPRARPTLLLPAPIKPTRNTALPEVANRGAGALPRSASFRNAFSSAPPRTLASASFLGRALFRTMPLFFSLLWATFLSVF